MGISETSLAALQAWGKHYRVAIVHDWLVVPGGAEKVLDALLEAFPQAEVFTTVYSMPKAQRGRLARHRVHTSWLQRLPAAHRYYRYCLPMMPAAVARFALSDFDLVISSSHAVAKGVVTHAGQHHLCYCHTPMRYAWEMRDAYLRDAHLSAPLGWCARRLLERLRRWDASTAGGVDQFIANSANVAGRIRRYYRRDASVIHPPVDLDAFPLHVGPREPYYLAASRLVPYKRLDLIVDAFRRMPDKRLRVIGDGPERGRLEALADRASNIEILGFQPLESLRRQMAQAQAFVFAADEDFGIMPLEAQAVGTPVIAYGHGGALETVLGPEHGDAATGVFFTEQSAESLCHAVECFESMTLDPLACRRQAERFSTQRFWAHWQALLSSSLHEPGVAS